ncbi:MAG: hypothetical protein RDU25_04825 [Patescibacteria group bacterium]|nr:hypothetical protein [Patescibacteria group bacterium]
MRHLFVSFTGTLGALKAGKVTESDLETGLFYFGCCREHAIDPWKEKEPCNEVLWFFRDDVEKGREVHARLVTAIEKAEAEGRCMWRQQGEHQSYEALNRLLAVNGFDPISVDFDGFFSNSYCYPGVVDRVKKAGLELEAVWR